MALEIGKDALVPATLIVPPPTGSAPIWKLSIELFLTVAEYLDSATCLTFSQTCRTLFELSKARSAYWRSARFAHGHLPRVAEMGSFTGEELRSAAVKGTNLEWKWEDKSPRLVRRVPVPYEFFLTRTFLASGSRWLFLYGMESHNAKAKIYDLVGNDFVKFYNSSSKEYTEAFSFEMSHRIVQIVGESLDPHQILFAAQFNRMAEDSIISVYLATFSQAEDGQMTVILESKHVIPTEARVRHCTLREGILGITTNEEATVEQWNKPQSKRKVEVLPSWLPCGLQVARNRLLLLESDRQDQPRAWQIRIFDISSLHSKDAGSLDEKGDQLPLFSTNVIPLLVEPVDPFYAPYWEDRPGDPGVHFGFKILLTSDDSLWHFDFHLDSELDETGSLQERLTWDSPCILGKTVDERPVGLTPGSYCLAPRASRIIWVGKQGEVRIRSDWTDDLTEDGGSCSRVLDLRSRPQMTPTILEFDENLGILLLNDTDPGKHVLFWFV